MNNELMRQATGRAPVSRQERPLVTRAKAEVDEVRLSGLKAQGIAAITEHTMNVALDLHKDMKAKSAGDEQAVSILVPIFLTGVNALHINQQRAVDELAGGGKYGF